MSEFIDIDGNCIPLTDFGTKDEPETALITRKNREKNYYYKGKLVLVKGVDRR